MRVWNCVRMHVSVRVCAKRWWCECCIEMYVSELESNACKWSFRLVRNTEFPCECVPETRFIRSIGVCVCCNIWHHLHRHSAAEKSLSLSFRCFSEDRHISSAISAIYWENSFGDLFRYHCASTIHWQWKYTQPQILMVSCVQFTNQADFESRITNRMKKREVNKIAITTTTTAKWSSRKYQSAIAIWFNLNSHSSWFGSGLLNLCELPQKLLMKFVYISIPFWWRPMYLCIHVCATTIFSLSFFDDQQVQDIVQLLSNTLSQHREAANVYEGGGCDCDAIAILSNFNHRNWPSKSM